MIPVSLPMKRSFKSFCSLACYHKLVIFGRRLKETILEQKSETVLYDYHICIPPHTRCRVSAFHSYSLVFIPLHLSPDFSYE